MSGEWVGHFFVALAICLGHYHAGRPIHDPTPEFWLREGDFTVPDTLIGP